LAREGHADIRPAHGYVFGAITGDAGIRLTELADQAHTTKQAMGEIVSDLERLGYAERVADPSDGRAKLVRLTHSGRRAQALGFSIIDDIEARWAREHGAEAMRATRRLLEDHAGVRAAVRRTRT
jgi:DNA-binding MarR family transcriptional regulator